MKKTGKRLLAALLLVAILPLSFVVAFAAENVPASVLKASESVVRIVAETTQYISTGSGFIVSNNKDATLIATNYHVVEGEPYQISVWIGEDETISAKILAYSDQKDLCILELQHPVSLPALKLNPNGIKQGDAVFAVGFPAAADYLSDAEAHTSSDATITDGIVSAIRQMAVVDYGISVPLLQINAAINSGNSGGPLFNASGEVVGINTYSVYDSQGIFGAIAIEELVSFAEDNNIHFISQSTQGYLIFFLAGIAVVAAAAAVIWKLRKAGGKKVKKERKEKKESPVVALPDYLTAMGGKLIFSQAVSLLLPVAIELRNLHDQGRAHLKVAPENIVVRCAGAMLSNSAPNSGTAIFSGFTPMELYRGKSAGHRSDIYSFCAVLAYAVTGNAPKNALERQESPEAPVFEIAAVEEAEPEYVSILAKGMAAAPQDRYATMQELIYELTPFNAGAASLAVSTPFEKNMESYKPDKPAQPVKIRRQLPVKKKRALIAAGIALGVIAVFLGGCALIVQIDYNHYIDGKDSSSRFITDNLYNNYGFAIEKYLCARRLFDNRKYELSASVFDKIRNFSDAGHFYLESQYRYAAQLADANDFDKAIEIYIELKTENYKDSGNLVNATKYRFAAYKLYAVGDFDAAYLMAKELKGLEYEKAEELYNAVLYEWGYDYIDKKDYLKAYEKFSEIPNYEDSAEVLETLKDTIYLEAQNDYRDENYEDAWNAFSLIKPYGQSNNYLTLLYNLVYFDEDSDYYPLPMYYSVDYDWDKPYAGTDLDAILNILYFEDAAEIIVSGDNLAGVFLLGKWKTSGGSYYFTMKSDGGSISNLPWYSADYYFIAGGIYWVYKDDDILNARAQYGFTVLTPDSISVYCFKNDKTYTLYRQ
ncbi:MAG: trypsin-like peptidase domain-containing protein [Bacillota bacterium]